MQLDYLTFGQLLMTKYYNDSALDNTIKHIEVTRDICEALNIQESWTDLG